MGAVLYSNIAQHTLSQATNISYLIRNSTRMKTVPDDRQADYGFRDLYMTLLVTGANEAAMRITEATYMAPNYVRHLGFHNFANEYKGIQGAQNYKLLPRPLERRLLGHLAAEKSFYQIGNILRHESLKLPKDSPKAQELRVLGEHFERRFDPKNYFRYYYQLDANAEMADKKAAAMQKVISSLKEDEIKHFAVTDLGQTPKQPSLEAQKILDRLFAEHEQGMTEAFGSGWRNTVLKHVKHGQEWNKPISELIRDGLSSRFVQAAVKSTRESGSYVKIAGGFLANTVLYAGLGTWFDFHVVQPWQKKLVEKRGTTKELTSPLLWSLIPMAGIFTGMHFLTRKMPGYGLRFSMNFAVSMLAYTAIAAAWIKERLSKPPQGKYAKYAEHGLHLQAERKAKEARAKELGLPSPEEAAAKAREQKKASQFHNPFSKAN